MTTHFNYERYSLPQNPRILILDRQGRFSVSFRNYHFMPLMFLSTQFRLLYFITHNQTLHRFENACTEQTVIYLVLDRLMRDFMKERAHSGLISESVLQSCLYEYIKGDKIFRSTLMNLLFSLKEKRGENSCSQCLIEKGLCADTYRFVNLLLVNSLYIIEKPLNKTQ